MQINLTFEIETALIRRAQQLNASPEKLALELLYQQLVDWQSGQIIEQSNMADFLAEHIGSIHSGDQHPGGARLSENTGKRFAEILQQKRRQGRW